MNTATRTATAAAPLPHEHEIPGALFGTADPSAGAGVAAAIGSTYGRDNAGDGELWLKVSSAADTDWTQLALVAAE